MGFTHETGTDQANTYVFQDFVPFTVGRVDSGCQSVICTGSFVCIDA
jgi:hypothetical protein